MYKAREVYEKYYEQRILSLVPFERLFINAEEHAFYISQFVAAGFGLMAKTRFDCQNWQEAAELYFLQDWILLELKEELLRQSILKGEE